MRKGKYKHRKSCRLCGSSNVELFLDLGMTPLAGNYLLEKDLGKELFYPLRVYYCNNCSFVQLLDIVDQGTLFKDYRYLSSVSLADHFRNFAKEMHKRFLNKSSFVVEIGSNDGVLLAPLQKYGMKVLGIDPAVNIAKVAKSKGINTIADYFTEQNAIKIVNQYGQADAIFANNVLAHIDNMDEVFRGIQKLLKPEGVLVFEVHYLLDLVQKLQYDFFYPGEHLSYYSLLSLIPFMDKYGIKIFDVKRIPIHSGSIRVYACKKGQNRKETKRVMQYISEEKLGGYNTVRPLKEFARKIEAHKKNLIDFLVQLQSQDKKIVGYGAAGRGNTLLNVCGISTKILSYIVDESPERYGRFTPGTNIPIVKPEVFRKDNPDYALLLAWSYKDAILRKEKDFIARGGKFIVPLPDPSY